MRKLAQGVSGSRIRLKHHFSRPDIHPFDEVEWETRSAEIKDWKTGKVSFRQDDLEFPKFWSQRATDIVSSKYFRGHLGTPGRERSVKQLIRRIVDTITGWGSKMDYFDSDQGRQDLQLRADLPAVASDGGVQLAGPVQRRDQEEAPVLRLLHQHRGTIPWSTS